MTVASRRTPRLAAPAVCAIHQPNFSRGWAISTRSRRARHLRLPRPRRLSKSGSGMGNWTQPGPASPSTDEPTWTRLPRAPAPGTQPIRAVEIDEASRGGASCSRTLEINYNRAPGSRGHGVAAAIARIWQETDALADVQYHTPSAPSPGRSGCSVGSSANPIAVEGKGTQLLIELAKATAQTPISAATARRLPGRCAVRAATDPTSSTRTLNPRLSCRRNASCLGLSVIDYLMLAPDAWTSNAETANA